MNRDQISLRIPSKPDYVSLVRLTASYIANRSGLNVDDIEDIKVSIGEACINSLCLTDKEEILIDFIVDEDKITIKVSDSKEIIPEMLDQARERELGIVIIKSLMDSVVFTDDGIEIAKYFE